MKKERLIGIALPCAAMALMALNAYAGTGGTEFQEIYGKLGEWSQGYLGKVVAAGAFLVGIAAGIVRQSIMAVVTGLGAAMAVQYTPTIIDSIVTGVI
jgi:conjugal transfer pilus assembly protein TraA